VNPNALSSTTSTSDSDDEVAHNVARHFEALVRIHLTASGSVNWWPETFVVLDRLAGAGGAAGSLPGDRKVNSGNSTELSELMFSEGDGVPITWFALDVDECSTGISIICRILLCFLAWPSSDSSPSDSSGSTSPASAFAMG